MVRFTRFSYRERYGLRLRRLAIDGGFTCPNRDGHVGTGGCTFCDNRAFHPSYTEGKSIIGQIEAGIAFHAGKKEKVDGYLAYFQTFSNTYAGLDLLRQRYEEALSHPEVKGIVIGTRPDCIDDEKLDYLKDIMDRGFVTELEYGIESVYDRTLERVNRGHSFQCTREALAKTAEHGIPACGHIILGLPGETREMMTGEAAILSELPLSSLKIHQLQILKGTRLEAEYRRNPGEFMRMGPEEYLDLLCDFLERLRPDIAISRIVSSVPPSYTDMPWGLLRHDELLRRLENRLVQRDTSQGRLHSLFP